MPLPATSVAPFLSRSKRYIEHPESGAKNPYNNMAIADMSKYRATYQTERDDSVQR